MREKDFIHKVKCLHKNKKKISKENKTVKIKKGFIVKPRKRYFS